MAKKEFKYQMLERRTREIIKEYTEKLSIRQVYYRLVVAEDIPNNRSQYVYFDDALTKARQKDLKLASYFEDRTRTVYNNSQVYYPAETMTEAIEWKIDQVKTSYPTFSYNRNLLQQDITVILVEKQALEPIFQNALGNNAILVVSRGFNSFTQLYELQQLINRKNREQPDLKFHLYIFTDFDDSGLQIQENFLRQMRKHLKIHFDTVERIALNKDQIEKWNIPTNPEAMKEKKAKSTHKDYKLPYFVELDALNPRTLTALVKDVCNRHFDLDMYEMVRKVFKIRNRRLKKKYFKELKNLDLSEINDN